MSREAGWLWWEGGRLGELAERSLEERRTADGERYGREFLRIATDTADQEATMTAVALLAWAAAQRGDEDTALELWGGVEFAERLRPMARWQGMRDRYAREIPEHESADSSLTLDEAVERILGAP